MIRVATIRRKIVQQKARLCLQELLHRCRFIFHKYRDQFPVYQDYYRSELYRSLMTAWGEAPARKRSAIAFCFSVHRIPFFGISFLFLRGHRGKYPY
jgi:hypothetical protein